MLADDYVCYIEDVPRDGMQFGGGAEMDGFDHEPSNYVQRWSRDPKHSGPRDSDVHLCWKLFDMGADVHAQRQKPVFDNSVSNELKRIAGGNDGRDVLILSGDRKGCGVATVSEHRISTVSIYMERGSRVAFKKSKSL